MMGYRGSLCTVSILLLCHFLKNSGVDGWFLPRHRVAGPAFGSIQSSLLVKETDVSSTDFAAQNDSSNNKNNIVNYNNFPRFDFVNGSNVSFSSNGKAFPPLEGELQQQMPQQQQQQQQNQGDVTTGDIRRNNTTSDGPLPSLFLTQSVLAIDPSEVRIVTQEILSPSPDAAAVDIRQLPFVKMFRGSANYIANHRNTIAVYHIPGGLLDLPDQVVFRDIMNDVALTWLLGMKIVLVVGCRHQVEKRIAQSESTGIDLRSHRVAGLRVTDQQLLRVVKEEAGYVRFEVERQLARSLRMQSASQTLPDGNVVSGNFYSAQPFGILDGVDYQYTGFVRRVEVEKIRKLFDNRDICLLTTLGVSPSGEVFNVNSESLAATVAGNLGASKIIYFTCRETHLEHTVHGNMIQHLRSSDAKNLLKHHGMKIDKRGFAVLQNGPGDLDRYAVEMLHKIGWSIQAIEQGVKRAHIISPKYGSVLQELYTRDGSGTLISGDLYEGIRRATVNDVSAIHDLISPLIAMGTLVDRPKATLEKDIDQYYVYTRDNHIVACGQLKQFENGFAEIGCLVVNKEYRARGRGDAMLGYLERMCVLHGCTSIFVLSTQTMEWFVERGFQEVSVDRLPPSRQATYNHQRKSKIYFKQIESTRDLDASELWWNR